MSNPRLLHKKGVPRSRQQSVALGAFAESWSFLQKKGETDAVDSGRRRLNPKTRLRAGRSPVVSMSLHNPSLFNGRPASAVTRERP